jgi:predicted CoA-binding protein
MKQSDPIYELLARAKTIAVVGLSESPMRPSHGVSAYMQAAGYKIIPVNPQIAEALGEKSYPSLLEVPLELREKIDLVDVFRRPEYVDEIVEQAIQVEDSGDLAAGRCDQRARGGEGAKGRNLCGDGSLRFERAPGEIRANQSQRASGVPAANLIPFGAPAPGSPWHRRAGQFHSRTS